MTAHERLSGLTMLADLLQREVGWAVTPERAAYFIRQLHIGTGCLHQCSHCFAQSPTVLRQATLSSFRRLAAEIGIAVRRIGEPLPFLYFGASSDPSAIENFDCYLLTWVKSMPSWQSVKVFTHGWLLADANQRNEFTKVLKLFKRICDRVQTGALSVDSFSALARLDWSSYLSNVAENLRGFAQVLPLSALKLQVHFPLDRLRLTGPVTLQYWRDHVLRGEELPDDRNLTDRIESQVDENSQACARLTSAVFRIGVMAGLTTTETALIARDGGVPFASGRARTFFEGRPQDDADLALKIQREQTLRPLESFEYGSQGVVILPDGRARLVDCEGYRLGNWLNANAPVFSYMKSEVRTIQLSSIPAYGSLS